MNLEKFKDSYDSVIAESNEPRELKELMESPRKWSSDFSDLIINFDPSAPEIKFEADKYIDWCDEALPEIDKAVVEEALITDDKAYYKAYNELTFHLLNRSMFPQWGPFFNIKKQPKPNDRIQIIKDSQDFLALDGSLLYMYREQHSCSASDFSFFDKNNSEMSSSITGRLSEIDSAIVLLDYAKKHHNTVVVPSPPAFEKYSRVDGKSSNSDFLVYDYINTDIAGVQVKSTVNNNQLDRYDQSRILFIDTRYDLDCYKYTRTKNQSTDKRLVSWPGYISMAHINSIKTNGNKTSLLTKMINPNELIKIKMKTNTILNGVKVQRHTILGRLEPRINKILNNR